MELRHLRYFVAVAEELSFRRAAARLHVSGPALSKQIKNLEEETGMRLFERNTVNVSLTPAGEVFLEEARELLSRSRQAVERALEAQAGHRGKLRIGSVGAIAAEFLPVTLKAFRERYPGVEVAFVEMLPIEQLDGLLRGEIDIAFSYGPEEQKSPGLQSLCMVRSTLGLAMSKQHPWAGRESVRLEELRTSTLFCIGKEQRSVHREEICHFCAAEGFVPKNLRQVEGFDSLLNLIAADEGVSMLPMVLDLGAQGVRIVPLSASAPRDFRMWAVWKKEVSVPFVRHFVQLLERKSRL